MSKKRANSRFFEKKIKELKAIQDVKDYLERNNIVATSTPYIFTHINLSNGQIITQNCGGFVCSPDKLARELGI